MVAPVPCRGSARRNATGGKPRPAIRSASRPFFLAPRLLTIAPGAGVAGSQSSGKAAASHEGRARCFGRLLAERGFAPS